MKVFNNHFHVVQNNIRAPSLQTIHNNQNQQIHHVFLGMKYGII